MLPIGTQIDAHTYYTFTYDESTGILYFNWLEATAGMSDEEFKAALRRFTDFANQKLAALILVDVRAFRHKMAEDTEPWWKAEIVPHYNTAGVKRFAYLLPAGPALPPSTSADDVQAFDVVYFNDLDVAHNWLKTG